MRSHCCKRRSNFAISPCALIRTVRGQTGRCRRRGAGAEKKCDYLSPFNGSKYGLGVKLAFRRERNGDREAGAVDHASTSWRGNPQGWNTRSRMRHLLCRSLDYRCGQNVAGGYRAGFLRCHTCFLETFAPHDSDDRRAGSNGHLLRALRVRLQY